MVYVLISVLKISGLLDVLKWLLDPPHGGIYSSGSRGNRNFGAHGWEPPWGVGVAVDFY